MDELPLLELFTRLREAGVPLGIRDYEAVLHALQAGYGVAAPEKNASRKSCGFGSSVPDVVGAIAPDEQQLFDYYFEQLLTSESLSESPPSPRPRVLLLAVSLVSVWLLGTGGMMWMMHQKSIAPTNKPPSPTPALSPKASASPVSLPSPCVAQPCFPYWDYRCC